ncbi:methyltransferase domain-containing protein [Streptomyces sp. NPDC091371]|uniref:methyltransferase domain-containing protein n=1 Tax=Streptomyces sp. NPDC091371 TaxID=3155303 RepID=UPI0034151A37
MDRLAAAAEPFDKLGADYERAFGHLPEQLAALEWLAARLPQGARVLDVGSGTGRPVAEALVRAGFRVTGIDVSATMVGLARDRVPGGRFERHDVRDFQAPDGSYDAVCAFFPLLRMSRAEQTAVLEHIARWLVPGGLFVSATVPGDMEDRPMVWMGMPMLVTSFPAEQYLNEIERTGLSVLHSARSVFSPDSDLAEPEHHLFCYARRPGGPPVPAHALLGPYPLPGAYRGAHTLSGESWTAFEPYFEREDIAAVVDALDGNERVLDVGGGTGAGVRAIAARLGRCATVEPHAALEETIRAALPDVEVHSGRAEALPLADDSFDAVVATWVLHYTDDPDAAIAEMLRVLDRSHPAAKVVLAQGAPDNEMIRLLNTHCTARAGEQPDHQGYLLTRAAELLAAAGLDDISFRRVGGRLALDRPAPDDSARTAADVLADVLGGFWHTGHPDRPAMREGLRAELAPAFASGPHTVQADAVLLIARRSHVNGRIAAWP